MKKQILILVSVAVVSFLLGTLVSMGLTANGIMANPFEEKRQSSPQIIRFQRPDETFIPSDPTNSSNYRTIEIANFTWTPKDDLNNVVLSAHYWAEFKSSTDRSVTVDDRLRINGATSDISVGVERTLNIVWGEYLSPLSHCWMNNWLRISSAYTIKYSITLTGRDSIYVRNINVILMVVDEL